jgi:hypothetical protein
MAGNPNRKLIAGADTYLPLWYNALDEEIGLLIRTDQRQLLVNTLYDARTIAQDPELEALMILQPAEDMIYIAKKATELEE